MKTMSRERYFDTENIDLQARKLLQECGCETDYFRRIYPPKSTALLVLDMQNFFLSTESRAFTPSAEAIVKPINLLIETFRKLSLPIIFTRHSNDDNNAGMMARRWKFLIPIDSIFSEIHPGIKVSDEMIILKSQYDAFHETQLDDILKSKGIKSLVITGLLQNFCVESTLRSAFVKGYAPIIPVDCTAANDYDLHLSSLKGIASGFCTPCISKDVIDLVEREYR